MSTRRRRVLRIFIWSLTALLILLIVAGFVFWLALKASLPQLDGTLRLSGLKDRVLIERDALGVPTIRAHNRLDAARTTGFLHAQDRFFHMDLTRRMGAGELTELLGPAVLDVDRGFRLHRLRKTAREAMRLAPPAEAELIKAYAEGVNAGLKALGSRPPEYLVLRSEPRDWLPEDSLLVAHAMFFFLQDSRGRQEAQTSLLARILPPKAFDFFLPLGTEWDAAVDGSATPVPALPTSAEFSFKTLPGVQSGAALGAGQPSAGGRQLSAWFPPTSFHSLIDGVVQGSNSWAVEGRLSTSGSALVANDMHLGLRLPNTWYRARIVCQARNEANPTLDITGVTLPGVPAVIVGSNRQIAWAFTNSMLDTTDLILLEMSPDNPRLYKTPQGWLPLREETETLHVKGGQDQKLAIDTTIWGPVVPGPANSPKKALRWLAHLPDAVNLNLIGLESIGDVEAALQLAPTCGVPAQNFVVGDKRGQVGWTLMGRLPRRVGFNGQLPVSWADGSKRWDGWIPSEEYPKLVSPPDGRIWTANNRIAGSPAYLAAGPWDVDLGARANQIRNDLRARERFSPADMLAIQLDDRAVFLERWRGLLLSTLSLDKASRVKEAAEARKLLEDWGGRAAVQSAGYRLVRGFRAYCIELALEPITERCRKVDPQFDYPTRQVEHAIWVMLTEKPSHLLNPRFQTYDDLLVGALEKLIADLRSQGMNPADATWGKRNLVQIRHPLSAGIPLVGRWLDIEPQSLPGDSHMPRVQSPGAGASERLAVSPGHEEQGLFHMPGGQSGHFLSEYYTKGHDAWASGRTAPFLPGPARHTLTLEP